MLPVVVFPFAGVFFLPPPLKVENQSQTILEIVLGTQTQSNPHH